MENFNHLDEQIAELKKELEQPVDEVANKVDDKVDEPAEKPAVVDEPADKAVDEPTDDDEDLDVSDDKKAARAFANQRREKRELKEALEKERTERQQLAERLAKLEGRAEATPQVKEEPRLEDQEPDADLYPEDHARWEVRQLKKELEDIKKFKQQQEQTSIYQREVAGVQALEGQFKAKTPDYDEAVQFLVEKEKRMKRILNPQINDAQIEAQVQAEKVALFKQILATGKNPAEVVYEIAKQDGWQPKSAAKETPKANLNTIAENQRRASNIIGGSAASSSGKVTADQLFSMSMDELVRAPKRVWDEAYKNS